MEGIDRTFSILELFLEHDTALGVSELSALSGLSPAVTHRIVTSLLKKGYLAQREKRGKYSLGLKFLDFSYVIQGGITITNLAYPFLLKLSKEADEAVTLAILDGREILVIERIDTNHDLRVGGAVGKRATLHSTAIGKLFLWQMSAEERRIVLEDPATQKFTDHSITDMERMEKDLARFKAEGCTYDREEMAIGIWSVAAPVYNSTGKIEAGVAILAPTARITDAKATKFAALTKNCAAQVSQALKYRRRQV
jgi:DNA-binding IclR family transcriptional regulator